MKQANPLEVAVFEAALQLPADQRAAYLEKSCGADAELRRRVEDLLGAADRAGGFMRQSAVPEPTVALHLPPTEKPGDTIGRYKLLEQIGEGGCGVVYMAEQQEPVRRRVALKVIKLGMDTKSVIARFEAERQALAMMDHPNIAKVLDAGATETGRPYFVMELVRGICITDYCDQNNLATVERLKLFTQICQAIQHAHQKGIIHRDIKPSNILVTLHDGVPVPKVIDFGIAKATTDQRLTDKTLFTHFEQFLGTPAYMSPEQAERSGLDIDTRSDIYSLGVLLYELLTGKTPFDARELLKAGLEEMRRTIREKEPACPSTKLSTLQIADLTEIAKHRRAEPARLTSLIRGDLDWIVMKALEKDRTRRYETANGLASDVQRHLHNEPVVACPPSRLYRFQKLVRRNKLAVAAASAVAVALVIGFAVAMAMFFRAEAEKRNAQAEKRRAQTEAAKSQQVAQFLQDMLKSVGPSVAQGRDATLLKEILDKTADRVGKDLINRPEVQVELYRTLASTYHDLGLYIEMALISRHSLQVARSKLGDENASVADSLIQLGDALQHLGETDSASAQSNLGLAEKYCRDGLAIRRKLLGGENLKVADALHHLADVLARGGKLEEAEAVQREALAMYRKLLGKDCPEVAKALYDLALMAFSKERLTEAEAMNREALAMQKKLLGDAHPEVAKSLQSLAGVLWRQGKLLEAENKYREALATWRKLEAAEDRPEVSRARSELIEVLLQQGKRAEAKALLEGETNALNRARLR